MLLFYKETHTPIFGRSCRKCARLFLGARPISRSLDGPARPSGARRRMRFFVGDKSVGSARVQLLRAPFLRRATDFALLGRASPSFGVRFDVY